jgi:hypothetical protein
MKVINYRYADGPVVSYCGFSLTLKRAIGIHWRWGFFGIVWTTELEKEAVLDRKELQP